MYSSWSLNVLSRAAKEHKDKLEKWRSIKTDNIDRFKWTEEEAIALFLILIQFVYNEIFKELKRI